MGNAKRHYTELRRRFSRIAAVRMFGMKAGKLGPGRATLTLDTGPRPGGQEPAHLQHSPARRERLKGKTLPRKDGGGARLFLLAAGVLELRLDGAVAVRAVLVLVQVLDAGLVEQQVGRVRA